MNLPLTALRAFDLVARHASFAHAARELNVTRPAVSKQVRRLEALLGCQLVIRDHPKLTLTKSGQQLAAGLQQGFDMISTSFQHTINSIEGAQNVRILVERDFASSWLAERIGGFLVENPGVSIEIVAERNGSLRMDEDFSFRIFYGAPGSFASSDLIERDLCGWIDLPLCTPDYATEHIADGALKKSVRLLIDRNYNPWKNWLAHSGVPDPGPAIETSVFNDTSMCLSAALSGSGLTIGDSFMALAAIRNGDLIAPFKIGLRSDQRYVICRMDRQATTKVESRFLDWITREIEHHEKRVEDIMFNLGVDRIDPTPLHRT